MGPGRTVSAAWLAVSLTACAPATPESTTKKHDLSFAHGDGFDFIDMARNTTSCAGGGMTCSSANPGACDKGTITCDGTLAMCTPDSALQDCYDGPGGTKDVGICKGGSQSCVGILGPCEGQVQPAAKEDCFNDLDDDCDAKVNNSCADGLALGLPVTGTIQGANTTGDVQVDARCPTSSFVNGVDIGLYNDGVSAFSLVQIRLNCATPTLQRGTSSYTLGGQAILPKPSATFGHPMVIAPSMYTTVDCGTTGLRGIINVNSKYDSGGFFGLNVRCGSASGSVQPDNTLKVTMSQVGGDQGYIYPLAGTVATWSCASDQVLIGFTGRARTDGIYKMAAICAPLAPHYKL